MTTEPPQWWFILAPSHFALNVEQPEYFRNRHMAEPFFGLTPLLLSIAPKENAEAPPWPAGQGGSWCLPGYLASLTASSFLSLCSATVTSSVFPTRWHTSPDIQARTYLLLIRIPSFLPGSLPGRLPPTPQGSLQRLPPSESIPGYPDPLISHHITGSSSSQPLFNSVLIICFSHENAKMWAFMKVRTFRLCILITCVLPPSGRMPVHSKPSVSVR